MMSWNTCTLRKQVTYQHRPNTKRKVRRGGHLTLMIDRAELETHLNQQWCILLHWQWSDSSQWGQCQSCRTYWWEDGKFIPQLLSTWIPCQDFHSSEDDGAAHTRHASWCGDKTVFDMETMFLLLFMVEQKRQLQLASMFQYELCTIPSSLIDAYGCLEKGNKSILANRLGMKQASAPAPDIVIVDIQHMLYHIIWPYGGTSLTSVKISSAVYSLTLLVQSSF